LLKAEVRPAVEGGPVVDRDVLGDPGVPVDGIEMERAAVWVGEVEAPDRCA
jgi:hypothetical protein